MKQPTQYTPGPWGKTNFPNNLMPEGMMGIGPTCKNIALVETRHGLSEAKANANLIAAAPELLEALETAVSWYQEWLELGPDAGDLSLDTLRKAIAKAKGEQQ